MTLIKLKKWFLKSGTIFLLAVSLASFGYSFYEQFQSPQEDQNRKTSVDKVEGAKQSAEPMPRGKYEGNKPAGSSADKRGINTLHEAKQLLIGNAADSNEVQGGDGVYIFNGSADKLTDAAVTKLKGMFGEQSKADKAAGRETPATKLMDALDKPQGQRDVQVSFRMISNGGKEPAFIMLAVNPPSATTQQSAPSSRPSSRSTNASPRNNSSNPKQGAANNQNRKPESESVKEVRAFIQSSRGGEDSNVKITQTGNTIRVQVSHPSALSDEAKGAILNSLNDLRINVKVLQNSPYGSQTLARSNNETKATALLTGRAEGTITFTIEADQAGKPQLDSLKVNTVKLHTRPETAQPPPALGRTTGGNAPPAGQPGRAPGQNNPPGPVGAQPQQPKNPPQGPGKPGNPPDANAQKAEISKLSAGVTQNLGSANLILSGRVGSRLPTSIPPNQLKIATNDLNSALNGLSTTAGKMNLSDQNRMKLGTDMSKARTILNQSSPNLSQLREAQVKLTSAHTLLQRELAFLR